MRILHRSWQNLLVSFFKPIASAFILITLLTQVSLAQTGYKEALKKLLEINQFATKDFKFLDLTLKKSYQFNKKVYDYRINKDYLNSVLFELSPHLSKYVSKRPCSLLELIEQGILNKDKDNVVVLDRINRRSQSIRQFKADSKVALKALFKTQCKNIGLEYKFSKYKFNQFLKKSFFTQKSDYSSCVNDFRNFSNNSDFIENLQMSKQSIKIWSSMTKSTRKQSSLSLPMSKVIDFYQYAVNGKKLCRQYSQTIAQPKNFPEIKEKFIKPICQKSFKNSGERKKCIREFHKLRSTCELFQNASSILPHDSCEQHIRRLSFSKKISPATTCWPKIWSESRKLAYYLFTHFSKEHSMSCDLENYVAFIDFLSDGAFETPMGSQVCYEHRFTKIEHCKNTFFVDSKHPSSIKEVLGNILSTQKIIPKSMKCNFVNENKIILTSQANNGCQITYLPALCSLNKCPLKIFINGKRSNYDLKFKYNFKFSFLSRRKSKNLNTFIDIIKRRFKLKQTFIQNTTLLKKKMNEGIIYGISCLEDLLPTKYPRQTFAQCNATSFTILGITPETKLITQLMIEDINFTRELSWEQIKQGVNNFSEQSKTRWTLYALYR